MQKSKILIVDDIPQNITLLKRILGKKYSVLAATDGTAALNAAKKIKPDLILLDIMMPVMNGYEVCQKLKENIETSNIPVIFVTAKGEIEDESQGFEVGAVDYITKPFSPPVVLARVKTHLELYNQNLALEKKVVERTLELSKSRFEIIKCLSNAIELRDNQTGTHVSIMSQYCKIISLELGLSEKQSETIALAAHLHDIGKIAVPDKILLKGGKLIDEEFDIIKKHCEYGVNIIGETSSKILNIAKDIIISHHEKWNGKGYPNGLKREEIPLVGRIAAVADVFDAVTSERPYKSEWEVEKAVDMIKTESGEHFDPRVVKAFLECLPKILKVKQNIC